MYRDFESLFAQAMDLSVAQVVLENEMQLAGCSAEEVYERLAVRWRVMQDSAQKALDMPQEIPGGLIGGTAQRQHIFLKKGVGFAGEAVNRAMALALSCSEVNASMGRVCAAPTAGSCGIVPAVLLVAAQNTGAGEKQILDALLVAGGVGAIITKNATVSGAEGGCQAECGAAAAMAAAAAVLLAGGNVDEMGNAVSLALMNCMGLVCDPVAGLVQLPCAFRNASQTANALISADMALAGQQALIPPDEVVEAMYRVGKSLPTDLRETALGGVAASKTAKKIEAAMS